MKEQKQNRWLLYVKLFCEGLMYSGSGLSVEEAVKHSRGELPHIEVTPLYTRIGIK